jgi:hypothetical protein
MEDTNTSSNSLFTRYDEELKKQVTINEFNMKDIQMGLPAVRHYWVSRLMFHKHEVTRLKKLKKQAKQKVMDKIIQESPVSLTSKTLDTASDEHPVLQRIDEQIVENEYLIEYLSKVEVCLRNVSYDISNLIKIMQLETT